MRYVVRELPKAIQDKVHIFRWLHDRSPAGAAAWLDAYDEVIERLAYETGAFGVAPESKECEIEVRQALFRTRRGRVYRALFHVEGDEVFILRLRGPGQAPINPGDLD
jgi:plasmid stabilization system protein ParE